MVGQIYPTELHINKVNISGTEAPILDLDLSHLRFMKNGMILILK